MATDEQGQDLHQILVHQKQDRWNQKYPLTQSCALGKHDQLINEYDHARQEPIAFVKTIYCRVPCLRMRMIFPQPACFATSAREAPCPMSHAQVHIQFHVVDQ
jgi:hypothetical protein